MWPPLEGITFTKNKPATEDDVNAGSAVFVLKVDGNNIGVPLNIEIPQYAYHNDQESGQKIPVIIIQAEEAQGQKYIGAISVEKDQYIAGFANEFELLGINIPSE